MPEYFIRKETGKSPAEFFGAEMSFSGSHDKTAALVQAGTFEAGAVDYVAFDGFVKEKKVDPEIVTIVWVTPDYVGLPLLRAPADRGGVRQGLHGTSSRPRSSRSRTRSSSRGCSAPTA
jgi:ABC-type phosphate/phosphonate transport system substrate-binding protein